MSKDTGISWTDHTFNPWWGCTAVSAGCDHCYAETFDSRLGGDHWGKGKPRRIFGEEHWQEPIAWNEAARKAGKHALVFCASMADVMDDEAPAGQRSRLWELIAATPYLTWQLLTKRPQRYARWLPRESLMNIWLGATCEDQATYDLRWPILRRVADDRDLTTFVSYEPAMGPLSMSGPVPGINHFPVPDWLICGGETGDHRRPMPTEWATAIAAECALYGVKFWMKQMSARTPVLGAALIPAGLLIRQRPEAE